MYCSFCLLNTGPPAAPGAIVSGENRLTVLFFDYTILKSGTGLRSAEAVASLEGIGSAVCREVS